MPKGPQLCSQLNEIETHPDETFLSSVTLLDLFQHWVQVKPDATALLYDPLDGGSVETCSYAQLAYQSAIVARKLQDKSVGPETRVGLCLPPSCERMIAVFGVLSAGAAFVPIDPDYPAERIANLFDDAGLSLVLTHKNTDHLPWPEGVERLVLDRKTLAEETPAPRAVSFTGLEACYLIYTSGSTGKPKGIVVSHQGLLNLIRQKRSPS